ncbi:MAG TPA: glycine cleavage system protein GcvH [Verrucomicrobiales bacterium]|nr:glycine cleavage system protein GcvH [Verrucomicrobiales bacterium]
MSEAPEELRYRDSHEWIELGKEIAAVGITDHAQGELGDLVYIELPTVGRVVEAGEAVAVVESVKAASDIYAPVSGEVAEVNLSLESDPGLVNGDPYGSGWLFRLRVRDAAEAAGLLDAAAYRASIGE